MDAKQKKIFKTKKFFAKKRKKVTLSFDPEERREFLTGFQKRKSDRKIKAKELLKIQLRDEKMRQKQKRKENMDKLIESQRLVPEVETILAENTVTYELPKQTVSITTFDAKEVSGSLGMSLGHNSTDDNKIDHKLRENKSKDKKLKKKFTKSKK